MPATRVVQRLEDSSQILPKMSKGNVWDIPDRQLWKIAAALPAFHIANEYRPPALYFQFREEPNASTIC